MYVLRPHSCYCGGLIAIIHNLEPKKNSCNFTRCSEVYLSRLSQSVVAWLLWVFIVGSWILWFIRPCAINTLWFHINLDAVAMYRLVLMYSGVAWIYITSWVVLLLSFNEDVAGRIFCAMLIVSVSIPLFRDLRDIYILYSCYQKWSIMFFLCFYVTDF